MPSQFLTKVNPEGGGGASQPTVLTLPKATGANLTAGDPVYVRNGEAGNLPYWQEAVPLSTLPLSDATPATTSAHACGTLVMTLDAAQRFIAVGRISLVNSNDEYAWLTITDTHTGENRKYVVQPHDISTNSEYKFSPSYSRSPDGLKTAFGFMPNGTASVTMCVLENTNGTLDGFTLNGQALSETAVNVISPNSKTNGSWTMAQDAWFAHWDTDSNGVAFVFCTNTSNSSVVTYMPLSTYICTNQYGNNSSGGFVNYQNFSDLSNPHITTEAGNFLHCAYNGNVYLYSRSGYTLTELTSAIGVGTTAANSVWIKHSATEYTCILVVNWSPGTNILWYNVTLDETPGSETITVGPLQTESYEAPEGFENGTHYVMFIDSTHLYYRSYNSAYNQVISVPYTSAGPDFSQAKGHGPNAACVTATGAPRGFLAQDRDVYPVYDNRYASAEHAGTVLTAVWDIEEYGDKFQEGIKDYYLGTALSVSATEVEVAVERELVGNNEQKTPGTKLGNHVVISDDYAVEVVGDAFRIPKVTESGTGIPPWTGDSGFNPYMVELNANEWLAEVKNTEMYMGFYHTTATSIYGEIMVDGELVMRNRPLGVSLNGFSEWNVQANQRVSITLFSTADNMRAQVEGK